jgi:hypothetical protein
MAKSLAFNSIKAISLVPSMWFDISSKQKGLPQGDPLSPLLFNIIADMFAMLIKRANEEGQVSGVAPIYRGWWFISTTIR